MEELYNYHREDCYNPETIEKLMYHYGEVLRLLGEDPEREGLSRPRCVWLAPGRI